MKDLQMLNCFNDEICVNNVTSINEICAVVDKAGFFRNNDESEISKGDDEIVKRIHSSLMAIFPENNVNIPIKKILFMGDTSKFAKNPEEEFVDLIVEYCRNNI